MICEGAACLNALRQSFRLCEISSTFFVFSKVKLVDGFIEQLSNLDKYVDPKYKEHKFSSLISALANDSANGEFENASLTIERLHRATELLAQYLEAYGATQNDHGGHEFLYKYREQLGSVIDLLEELRKPWNNKVSKFPVCL
uniref:Uncharacterized protein n=1 Tax=Candidatus Kentrum sp. UNK TaxID=2126344 RepID=A0A451AV06_9GAMM|nr:MAG: hypothetical protein BECKUNK1418H_GA0071006_102039 [Candidatus Kentron sp. UNK]